MPVLSLSHSTVPPRGANILHRAARAVSPQYILSAPSPRRVRVMYAGEVVADSTGVKLLFETGKLPVYYFPSDDVRMDVLSASSRVEADDVKGPTQFFDLGVGGVLAKLCLITSRCGPNSSSDETTPLTRPIQEGAPSAAERGGTAPRTCPCCTLYSSRSCSCMRWSC